MQSLKKLLQAVLFSLPLLMAVTAAAGASAASSVAVDKAVVKREIDHLLQTLVTSKCRFNRNGSWYDGADAKSHLIKKYDYFMIRGEITTAESFINLAASKSSLSGDAYMVQCGDAKPLKSADWLQQELARYRNSAK
ncbi:DUF5329 domain-containing protein [Undibacterium sp.]|jgi:hypothetical protein|uniref:DUF5329 domain-containing protein n=1 Tax=Undibacterium sp. TaxID=1914977 RepID=UPI002BF5E4C3|nr:DUF5329 domain-containing protein [Undibacterium sp.]HTD05776.1 DUF5329 domain-containing protein [Undibacterium sp.]